MGVKLVLPAMSDVPATRAEAIAVGSKFYCTGVPCVNGHLTLRVTSGKICLECRRLKSRRNYHRDPAPAKEAARRRYVRLRLERPEVLREKAARVREKNREAIRVQGRIHAKKWRAKNPEKVRQHERNRRALKRGAEGSHTVADIARIREMQRDRCACCRAPLRGKGNIDHIVPLAAGGSNWPSNLQMLCRTCNLSKRATDPIAFMQSRGMLL